MSIPDLSEPDRKREYETSVLERARTFCNGAVMSFGHGRALIVPTYGEWSGFNACVGPGENCYALELGEQAPWLLLVLFNRILAEPNVLPWLSSEGKPKHAFAVPFAIDPARPNEWTTWRIEIGEERAFAANVLTDIVLAFAIKHEIGHVMCGHIEGVQVLEAAPRHVEMPGLAEAKGFNVERRRAWEFDADSVACALLVDYLDLLVKCGNAQPHASALLDRGAASGAHLLAMTVAGLFAFFCYLRGAQRLPDATSTHPHPYVRSLYIKDMLFHAAKGRLHFDMDEALALMDERLDEMLIALHELGLSDNASYDDDYLDLIEAEYSALDAARAKYRQSCAEWSWISWKESRLRQSD